jgi:hypothetical protein
LINMPFEGNKGARPGGYNEALIAHLKKKPTAMKYLETNHKNEHSILSTFIIQDGSLVKTAQVHAQAPEQIRDIVDRVCHWAGIRDPNILSWVKKHGYSPLNLSGKLRVFHYRVRDLQRAKDKRWRALQPTEQEYVNRYLGIGMPPESVDAIAGSGSSAAVRKKIHFIIFQLGLKEQKT